jgi:hypothetical protein
MKMKTEGKRVRKERDGDAVGVGTRSLLEFPMTDNRYRPGAEGQGQTDGLNTPVYLHLYKCIST